MTKEEEIEKVHGNGTHVVILGAGASIASTLKNPERSGLKLPSMANIIEVLDLDNIVNEFPEEIKKYRNDFERLYSKLVKSGSFFDEIGYLEMKITDYFSQMDLPDEPTIYDYLILSLRHEKDVIATFNWDPFLLKAYYRNMEFVDSPGVLHLHGSVALGYDKVGQRSGPIGMGNKATGEPFLPTQLLYPVEKKDYSSSEFIKGQWDALVERLKEAERVSVFGYSAPTSDVEAIELLKSGWGSWEQRNMEEFELIDIRDEEEVKTSWDKFIHTHHYHFCTDYFDSSFALHPRRTVESHRHRTQPLTISEAFQDGNPIPQDFKNLNQLWEWHSDLIEAERKFFNKS